MSKKWMAVYGTGMVLSAAAIEVHIPEDSPPAAFAQQQITAAAADTLPRATVTLRIDPRLGEQAYEIQADRSAILIRGGDSRGLMYGGLELAERIRFGETLKGLNVDGKPFIKRRGLKMNIPLDARCPSFDDSGDAARMNIEHVWSEAFWHDVLDRMAEHRYNTLTLWCNHPFSAMLELKDYPDVALHDIAVPTYQLNDQMLPQYKQAELQNPENYQVVKKMPMAEKVAFWQHIMRYAQERGIDIYFLTWNIWVHGAEGKYGIDASQTNPQTVEYMRESVKQFVLTYPDLKGLGITCGEHMDHTLEGENAVEKWVWNTYGQGIIDAKKEQPDREIHFIHSLRSSGADTMMDDFISQYPDPVSLGFNYARARLYSVHNPSFFNNELRSECQKKNLSSWMNLRNDDLFNFRWGDPDYVRMYMLFLPKEPLLAGYQMGSDGYVWGREFSSRNPDSPRQLEIDKHWYKFMLWGRLGYNPSLGRVFFEKTLKAHFPETDSPNLYNTWQTASKIVPLINTWHWRSRDHMWSVETCMSKKEGYHSVNHFIEFRPLPDQNMLSIDEFVRIPMARGRSPLDVATDLDRLSLEVRAGIKLLKSGGSLSKELHQTLGDLEAFAWLGHYYADKIRGSTELHRFRVHGLKHHQKRAVNHLKAALLHWKSYARTASALYHTQLLARTSYTDWNGALLDYAEQDIEIARTAAYNVFPPSVLKKN